MTWDELFDAHRSLKLGNTPAHKIESVKDARRLLSNATKEDWNKLEDALSDDDLKWFVAAVFSKAPVPKRLVKPMLRAAVYERNPSFNRCFVEPCIGSFGHRLVNEVLLEYLETGSDFEKAGAVNASYWAGMSLSFSGTPSSYSVENATPDSRDAYLKLQDVWIRRRCLYLREFVANEDVHVRRSIIPSLKLDESNYPDDLKPLVKKAIEIARTHEDEYIRHRVEVQLGNERLLKPLPHRDLPDEKDP